MVSAVDQWLFEEQGDHILDPLRIPGKTENEGDMYVLSRALPLDHNIFQTMIGLAETGRRVLTSLEVHRVAEFTNSPIDPTWLEQERARLGADRHVESQYLRLAGDIYGGRYRVVAAEILSWPSVAKPVTIRIPVPASCSGNPDLLTGFSVRENGRGSEDYVLERGVAKPLPWPTAYTGTPTEQMVAELGRADMVLSNSNPNYQGGLRALAWEFRHDKPVYLDSSIDPLSNFSNWKVLVRVASPRQG